MITDIRLQAYDGGNPLPDYVKNVRAYTLIGTVPGDYKVILGRLTTGESDSAGKPLAHALFESFTDHGDRAKVARTRVSGFNREFISILNAMCEAGVEFDQATVFGSGEEALRSLGEWFKAQNEDISEIAVVSQTCH